MSDATFIKPDPEAAASPAVDDEDLYEDAGDLEFFDTTTQDNPYSMVYMARVPKYIWDAWSSMDDDAEIRIGTIRQWNEQGLDGTARV
jgi:transcription initiation factor TFIIF subunit beta